MEIKIEEHGVKGRKTKPNMLSWEWSASLIVQGVRTGISVPVRYTVPRPNDVRRNGNIASCIICLLLHVWWFVTPFAFSVCFFLCMNNIYTTKAFYYLGQGYTNVSELQELSRNSRRQNDDCKQVQYWGSTNTGSHSTTEFVRPWFRHKLQVYSLHLPS